MAPLPRIRARMTALVVALGLAAIGLAVTAPGAHAATGCQVTYRLNQWSGGFIAHGRHQRR